MKKAIKNKPIARQQKADKDITISSCSQTLSICKKTLQYIIFDNLNETLHKQYFQRHVEAGKTTNSVKFAHENYQALFQNPNIKNGSQSPRIPEEQSLKPIRPVHAFFTQAEQNNISQKHSVFDLISEQEENKLDSSPTNKAGRQKRSSSNVYNPNRPYIIKRSSKRQSLPFKESVNSIQSLSNLTRLDFNSRCSHRGISQMNKTMDSCKSFDKGQTLFKGQRYSSRADSNFIKQQNRNSSFHMSQSKEGSRGFKELIKKNKSPLNPNPSHKLEQKLIRLPTEEEKDFLENRHKVINSYGQDVNSYVNFLRDRKIKLEGVMKVFDQEEQKTGSPGNQIIGLLSKIASPQIKKSSNTKSLDRNVTTDYEGNLMTVSSSNRTKVVSDRNEMSLMKKVPFKVKQCDDLTKTFLQKIMSSNNKTPSSKNINKQAFKKKINFNTVLDEEQDLPRRLKANNNHSSVSLVTSEKSAIQPSSTKVNFYQAKYPQQSNQKTKYGIPTKHALQTKKMISGLKISRNVEINSDESQMQPPNHETKFKKDSEKENSILGLEKYCLNEHNKKSRRYPSKKQIDQQKQKMNIKSQQQDQNQENESINSLAHIFSNLGSHV